MELIIGGAYQGKLDYAKEKYALKDGDIFTCRDKQISFSSKCVNKLEEFTFACIQNSLDPVGYFMSMREEWQDCIFICQDMSCGVVPIGADMRQWRQETGRLCQYLSHNADHVYRIFCGLEQKLK